MKPVFIVEGHSDAKQVLGALKGYGDFSVIVTNGTKVNNALIFKIEEAISKGYTPFYCLILILRGNNLKI
ncbi:MAG TPA: hypothetical protein VKU94_01920 [Geobacterales bacterium]|nr:hypothetical protein [Geobacterales bacterium]